MIRLDKLLSSRGYCSRKEVRQWVRSGRVLVGGAEIKAPDLKVDPALVTVDGEELDPAEGLLIMLHKPSGYSCSHSEAGAVVYDFLPARFLRRNPKIVSVGRLDKDTSGLLLLTDDGKIVHKLTSPKQGIDKVYEVHLRDELSGGERELFASGTFMLPEETKPLLPAELEEVAPKQVRITLHEGRYHQIRRMFAAVGNEVITLHRSKVGSLVLGELAEGEFKILSPQEYPKGTAE